MFSGFWPKAETPRGFQDWESLIIFAFGSLCNKLMPLFGKESAGFAQETGQVSFFLFRSAADRTKGTSPDFMQASKAQ